MGRGWDVGMSRHLRPLLETSGANIVKANSPRTVHGNRTVPPVTRRVPGYDDCLFYDLDSLGKKVGLLYFDETKSLTSKTKWIKSMIKKPEAQGRVTRDIKRELDTVLASMQA